ncbi:hypothetical protein C7974DRAFT_361563 [Boeremia exigua]|uniref:uncharacterized protein n=1 Tax=Boeremia exigua TaxID=749465 RepID=UPI001E8CC7B5|nr:uncharacterized protein C7974DRAFT_361563 [Boeremia exigua]KAH6621697.1 hypothetical protein C7974DRAFT_361563 [Boeremia exigua]
MGSTSHSPPLDHNSGEREQVVVSTSAPITTELPLSQRFAHGIQEWRQVPALPLREFTITHVINNLTDRRDWHEDVFRAGCAAQWYNELVLSTPLLSEKTWEWCMKEAKDKARAYKETGFVRVLDSGACVCKADGLELLELSRDLQSGLEELHRYAKGKHSEEVWWSYIDPRRAPLRYGKSRVLDPRGVAGNSDDVRIKFAPTLKSEQVDIEGFQQRMGDGMKGYQAWRHAFGNMGWQNIQKYYWSYKYQCLPSDVAFTDDSGSDVEFTSPVNGMSMGGNDLHRSFGRLVSALIEPWNECLIRGQDKWNETSVEVNGGWAPPGNERKQRGRVPCRIITYGVEWENEAPEWFDSFDGVRRRRLARYHKILENIELIKGERPTDECDEKTKTDYQTRLAKAESSATGYQDVHGLKELPEPTPELWQRAFKYLAQAEPGSDQPVIPSENWRDNVYRLLREKLGRMLLFKHPEPGTAFTYEQWRDGEHGGRAVVDIVTDRPIIPGKLPPSTPHEPYKVRLQDEFREKGLQIITRVDSIELSPEHPAYTGGEWELKGMKNEHVVAVGVFSFDVENVSESRIAFRQETDVSPGFFRHGPKLFQGSDGYSRYKQPSHEEGKGDQVEAISEIFGFNAFQMCSDHHDFALPFQELGDVALSQGRVVAFPNVMETRRMPFRLQDATQSGHHRWITVMLVDPHYRLWSTGHVLPRQLEWQGGVEDARNLPEEVDSERTMKEMAGEVRRMHYARYAMMGTFFFC